MTNDAADLVHRLARTLRAEVAETHISWILLVPGLACKLMKPVRLLFLAAGVERQADPRLAAALRLEPSRGSRSPRWCATRRPQPTDHEEIP